MAQQNNANGGNMDIKTIIAIIAAVITGLGGGQFIGSGGDEVSKRLNRIEQRLVKIETMIRFEHAKGSGDFFSHVTVKHFSDTTTGTAEAPSISPTPANFKLTRTFKGE